MQTSRRYDPTKDAKFHVSIATTEAIRRKWATPLESLHSPKAVASEVETPRGLSAAESALAVPTVSKNLKTTKAGNAPEGLSPVFEKRRTVQLVAPRGLSESESAPDLPTVSKILKTTKAGNAPKGLSPVFEKRRTVPLVAPRGLSESESAPDLPTVSKILKTTKAGNAPKGLSPVFEKRGTFPLSPEVTPRPRSATCPSEALSYAPDTRARARLPGG